MRVLVATNMYPHEQDPVEGIFVAEQVESLRDSGLEVDLEVVPRTSSGPGVYRRLAARVRTSVARSRPDVVHAMYGGVFAHEVARGAGALPMVVSFCGSDLLGDPLAGWATRASAAVGVRASHRVARRAAAVVVKSESLARALPRGVPRERVVVVPNGVDTGHFRPLDPATCRQRLGWTGPGPHVVFGARPRPVKRLWLAAAAVDLLRAEHPDVALHVPEEVDRASMPAWLNAADVVVLTSRHEGSPNVIKEALACGARIVAVPVGDVPERLRGVGGAAVVGDDPAEIAAGIRSVLAVDRDGRAAPSAVDLSLPAQAARLEELYRRVAAHRRGPVPRSGSEGRERRPSR